MKRALILLALVATTAHAEFLTGNKLRQLFEDREREAIAIGYTMGVYDADLRAVHCSPDGITGRQLSDIIKMWMANNPDKLHYSADSIILETLKSLWPCPERRPRGERLL